MNAPATAASGDDALLVVDGLTVRYDTPDGAVTVVDGVDLRLARGGTLGLVGESGSGKSQTALALIGLLAGGARTSGRVRFEGAELLERTGAALAAVRGARIGMVFQDPMSSLNPYLRIGRQLGEMLEVHRGASRAAARAEAIRMLDAVRLPEAARRIDAYPHELSGGQRQRVMIAMALMCRPALLIADEPTTALDITVQAQILALLEGLRRDFALAILMISHDLDAVASLCTDTAVMYAGRIVELAPTQALLNRPAHPYSRGLVAARPRLDLPPGAPLPTIPGQPPEPGQRPAGCSFAPRCPAVTADCARVRPALRPDAGAARRCACLRVAPDALS